MIHVDYSGPGVLLGVVPAPQPMIGWLQLDDRRSQTQQKHLPPRLDCPKKTSL